METERRKTDPAVQALTERMTKLEGDVAENTLVTKEVKKILEGFRMLGTFARWFAIVAGAVTAGIALLRSVGKSG